MKTLTVHIPNVLRHHTDSQRTVEVTGATVGAALDDLFAKHPSLHDSLIPASGVLFEATNLFLNDEDVSSSGGLDTPTQDGDSITILPAMAGGAMLPSGCRAAGAAQIRCGLAGSQRGRCRPR